MNGQIDDEPESRTADGYKTHLELLSKRLKYNGRQTVYTACMIGHCLSELKQIYNGNKLLMHAAKHLFIISYVYFFIDSFNLATINYRVSCMSLPLGVVRRKLKLIKEIVNEDDDCWMRLSMNVECYFYHGY